MQEKDLMKFVQDNEIHWEFSEDSTELSLVLDFGQLGMLQQLIGKQFFEEKDFLLTLEYGNVLILMAEILKYCKININNLYFK